MDIGASVSLVGTAFAVALVIVKVWGHGGKLQERVSLVEQSAKSMQSNLDEHRKEQRETSAKLERKMDEVHSLLVEHLIGGGKKRKTRRT